MRNLIYKIASPSHGINNVELKLAGLDLEVLLEFDSEHGETRQQITFEHVIKFEVELEKIAAFDQDEYDCLVESWDMTSMIPSLHELPSAYVPDQFRLYSAYFSNFGRLSVVCQRARW